MTKHTEGKWSIDGRLVVSDGAAIAEVYDGGFSSIEDIEALAANLKLLSAAPELLEACKAMIEWDDRENDHAVDFQSRMALCERAFNLARAAIAKATGEE